MCSDIEKFMFIRTGIHDTRQKSSPGTWPYRCPQTLGLKRESSNQINTSLAEERNKKLHLIAVECNDHTFEIGNAISAQLQYCVE